MKKLLLVGIVASALAAPVFAGNSVSVDTVFNDSDVGFAVGANFDSTIDNLDFAVDYTEIKREFAVNGGMTPSLDTSDLKVSAKYSIAAYEGLYVGAGLGIYSYQDAPGSDAHYTNKYVDLTAGIAGTTQLEKLSYDLFAGAKFTTVDQSADLFGGEAFGNAYRFGSELSYAATDSVSINAGVTYETYEDTDVLENDDQVIANVGLSYAF
ncbi:hypothetical protein AB6D11_06225 [Vibrio splendidus]